MNLVRKSGSAGTTKSCLRATGSALPAWLWGFYVETRFSRYKNSKLVGERIILNAPLEPASALARPEREGVDVSLDVRARRVRLVPHGLADRSVTWRSLRPLRGGHRTEAVPRLTEYPLPRCRGRALPMRARASSQLKPGVIS